MQPYNVEVFGRDFALIQHYNAGDVNYSYDYLSMTENTAIMPYNENVKRGQYIRLENGTRSYFGVISGLDVGSIAEGYTEIRYKPFLTVFDAPVVFDTNWQPGSGSASPISLEEVIARLIKQYWINNADASANIPGMTVTTISRTTAWGLHLTSDIKELHYTIINFYDVVLQRALTKYQIGVYVTPDVKEGTITVQVGRRETGVFYIEADLPSVIDRKIVLNSTTVDSNKLTVYSAEDFVTNMIFYKHTDGSYDRQNRDRIVPVIAAIQTVTPSQETPFAVGAQLAADRLFDSDTYSNLIEIEVLNEDDLVLPSTLTIGQIVSVITQGSSYPSIMTGVHVGATTRLVFGTVRVELTKRLRGLIRNG